MSDAGSRPNVLCFVADQLRYDHLGYAGNETVETPNIDELAAGGVAFDRAYVNNPICMPARSTLFTGLRPHDHGVRASGIPLSEDLPLLPRALRRQGYQTHAVGKLHLHVHGVPEEKDHEELDPDEYPEVGRLWHEGRIDRLPEPFYGFEETDFVGGHVFGAYGDYRNWLEENYPDAAARLSPNHPENTTRTAPEAYDWSLPADRHYNRWIADRACAAIEDAVSEECPFFLWCSFPDPHHPFAAPDPWGSKYDPNEVSLPTRRQGELESLPPFYEQLYECDDVRVSGLNGTTARTDEELEDELAVTYGMISFVDDEIGRVMSRLDELGIRDDTIVVVLSDHGDMMGDHWTIRKGPFHFEGLLRVPMVWNWPDHIEEGVHTEGLTSHLDFAPTVADLCGVEFPVRETLEPSSINSTSPLPGQSLQPQLAGEADAVNDAVIVENDEEYLGLRIRTYITERYKLTIYPGMDYGELFDLEQDPGELHNRWDDPDYRDVKTNLYRGFLEKYVETQSGLPRRQTHS